MNSNPPSNKPDKKSIFDKNPGLGASRSDVREAFKQMSDKTRVLHTMSPQEELALEKELFSYGSYGSHISKSDIDRKIQELSRIRYTVKDEREKARYQDKIDYLKMLKEK